MNTQSTEAQPAPTAGETSSSKRPEVPAIRSRLAFALAVWAFAWGAAVVIAVWLAAGNEVDELLDDTLRGSAELLVGLGAAQSGPAERAPAVPGSAVPGSAVPGSTVPGAAEAAASRANGARFAWQVVNADGVVQMRSALAPREPWFATPKAGFAHAPEWRLYGMPLGADGRMLYAAQTRAERLEARAEVVASAVVAAFSVGVLGLLWLRMRVRAETSTLQRLSDRLAAHDPATGGGTLGPAERLELQPVHDAIDQLTRKLAARVDTERAFAGHAAHALRTPLAGIDAQLAVAMRECPEETRPRIARARDAAARLRHVVDALLGLFRAGSEPARRTVHLDALVGRMPVAGLAISTEPGATVNADPDLLVATLINLLDNAARYGARQVRIVVPQPQTIRVTDDGCGANAQRRAELLATLEGETGAQAGGLGLLLAHRVARAHGGELRLPEAATGFAVEMTFGAPQSESRSPESRGSMVSGTPGRS